MTFDRMERVDRVKTQDDRFTRCSLTIVTIIDPLRVIGAGIDSQYLWGNIIHWEIIHVTISPEKYWSLSSSPTAPPWSGGWRQWFSVPRRQRRPNLCNSFFFVAMLFTQCPKCKKGNRQLDTRMPDCDSLQPIHVCGKMMSTMSVKHKYIILTPCMASNE